ncbi:MAG: Ig-like domain-containing domain [Cyclobacteriaceae bacterium]
MKDLFTSILITLTIGLLISRCANPISPTGGPKDTIPPILLNSLPINGSLNFKETTIHLEFSEYINADKLTQNLIITPQSDVRFKHVVKRNQLNIKFDQPFQDSTTYSLNFFDGITDITEKNPAVNLVLAFSTGNFIDTMSVSGRVLDLMTGKPSKEFLVGLYPSTDTLDFLTQTPLYFTTTNDSGMFNMSYIKAGIYKILSYKDENRNLLLDPETEDHGFISDKLNLQSPVKDLSIRTLVQNVKPLQLINNRPIGPYHEIKFNKRVENYTINPDSLEHIITGEDKDIIRIYNQGQFNYGDSTTIYLTANDSLSNTVNDTLKIVFLESARKPGAFKASITYKEKSMVNNPLYTIYFNKPISNVDESKFIYMADSSFSFYPDSLNLQWNQNKTTLELRTYLTKDSLYNNYQKVLLEDSIREEAITKDTLTINPKEPKKNSKSSRSQVQFFSQPGAFISIENDSSETMTIKHKEYFKQPFGTLKLKLVTELKSFTIQLLDARGNVAYSHDTSLAPVFNVIPDTYSVRILIDDNDDGKWTFGNLIQNIEPESVFLFSEKIPVRENWIVEDYTITF